MKDILEAVCELTGVTAEDIRGYERREDIREARLLFYELAIKEGYVYSQIGSFVNREYTNIIYVLNSKQNNPEYDAKFNTLCEMFGIEDVKEVEFEPIFNDTFKILDVSSRYFGSCFMGMINDKVVSHGCKMKVINEMLDRYERI